MKSFCGGRYVSDGSEYGSIFRCVSEKNGEIAAVKVWPEEAPEGERECALWRDCYGEFFLETGTENGKRILARRWIEGETLEEYRERKADFSEEETAEILLKIGAALRDFYEKTGMYFGDLKPENVILQKRRALLLDLESAEKESGDAPAAGIFRAKTLRLVTPGFGAPEIYCGRGCCKSDFYALGMLGAFLLGGIPDRAAYRKCSEKMGNFGLRCTEPEPEKRYACIEEAEAALQAVLQAERNNRTKRSEKSPGETRSRVREEKSVSGDGFGDSGREIPRDYSVANMNISAENVVFHGPGFADLQKNGENTERTEKPLPEDGALRKTAEPSPEPFAEEAPFPLDDGFSRSGEESGNGFGDRTSDELTDSSPDGCPEADSEEDAGKNTETEPSQRGPRHVEKSYRRLILYVPENISFATELGYVLGKIYGFSVLVHELCDGAGSRIQYYYPAGKQGFSGDAAFSSGDAPASRLTAFFPEDVPEENGGTDPERDAYSMASEPEAFYADSYGPVEGTYPGVSDLQFSAEICEEEGVSDRVIRDFMLRCYENHDMTVLCDSVFVPEETRLQYMRISDFSVLPVSTDVDEAETAIRRYRRFFQSRGLSEKKLKWVGWEYSARTNPEYEALFGEREKSPYLGSVPYEAMRHLCKNILGGCYCETMTDNTVQNYCNIIDRLVFSSEKV